MTFGRRHEHFQRCVVTADINRALACAGLRVRIRAGIEQRLNRCSVPPLRRAVQRRLRRGVARVGVDAVIEESIDAATMAEQCGKVKSGVAFRVDNERNIELLAVLEQAAQREEVALLCSR